MISVGVSNSKENTLLWSSPSAKAASLPLFKKGNIKIKKQNVTYKPFLSVHWNKSFNTVLLSAVGLWTSAAVGFQSSEFCPKGKNQADSGWPLEKSFRLPVNSSIPHVYGYTTTSFLYKLGVFTLFFICTRPRSWLALGFLFVCFQPVCRVKLHVVNVKWKPTLLGLVSYLC